MECEECGTWIDQTKARKRRRYCSSACRQRAYRRRQRAYGVPDEMRGLPRWTRADGKRPIQADGWPASSTDPTTWSTWAETRSGCGNGQGVMLGGGLVCIDLDRAFRPDGTLTSIAERVLGACPGAWVETSVSGQGLHVFGTGFERPGRKVDTEEGTSVELYSRARFIRVTGHTYRAGGLPAIDLNEVIRTIMI